MVTETDEWNGLNSTKLTIYVQCTCIPKDPGRWKIGKTNDIWIDVEKEWNEDGMVCVSSTINLYDLILGL